MKMFDVLKIIRMGAKWTNSFSKVFLSGLVLLFLLLFLSVPVLAQGTWIMGGTTMKVASGTTVVETVKLKLENGAALDNSGTLVLKGNMENQNSAQTDLGIGTFECSGSLSQTIAGLNTFKNLIINNSAGVNLISVSAGTNTRITGTLTLLNGLLDLGAFNLTMEAAASVSGTPSASKMVVATSTGEMRKEYSATGSFLFPVGDNTGTAEYSPVTLSFTSGTFGSGAYAGVKLVNSVWPGLTTEYLKRYWTVSQSGITGFNCNSQFNYVVADVTGTESNLYCLEVDPLLATFSAANTSSHYLTANGLTSLGTFTGGLGAVSGSFSVFLEGSYNSSTNLMSNYLPTTLVLGDRSDNTKFPSSQPYNTSPWGYNGTESIVTVPSNVADWVLVELRYGLDPSSTTLIPNGKAAGFLLRNGSIVGTDGVSPLRFTNLGSFSNNVYTVVRHRNHMAIMANNAVTKDANQIYTYDFSTGSDKVYGGTDGYKQIDASPVKWGMVAGDANADGNVWGNDYTNFWIPTLGNEEYYLPADFNMDTNVWGNDYTNFWVSNLGMENPIP
jgi:hypothetical protein